MDAVEMLKEKARLTKKCNIYCTSCRLGSELNGRDINCTEFQQKHPEQYVKIIEKWSKDCPKRTYLSKLLEVFPDTELREIGSPKFCPSKLGLKDSEKCEEINGWDKCKECWNQEWEEAQND